MRLQSARRHASIRLVLALVVAFGGAVHSQTIDLSVAALGAGGSTDYYTLRGTGPMPGTWVVFGPGNQPGGATVKSCQNSLHGEVYAVRASLAGGVVQTQIDQFTSPFVIPRVGACLGPCAIQLGGGRLIRDVAFDRTISGGQIVAAAFDSLLTPPQAAFRRYTPGTFVPAGGWVSVTGVGDMSAMAIRQTDGTIFVATTNGPIVMLSSSFAVTGALADPFSAVGPSFITDLSWNPCTAAGCLGGFDLVVCGFNPYLQLSGMPPGATFVLRMNATGSWFSVDLRGGLATLPISVTADNHGDYYVLRSDGAITAYANAANNTTGTPIAVAPIPDAQAVTWLTETYERTFDVAGATTLGRLSLNPNVYADNNDSVLRWDLTPPTANILTVYVSPVDIPGVLVAPGVMLLLHPYAPGAVTFASAGSPIQLNLGSPMPAALNGSLLYAQALDASIPAISSLCCMRIGFKGVE